MRMSIIICHDFHRDHYFLYTSKVHNKTTVYRFWWLTAILSQTKIWTRKFCHSGGWLSDFMISFHQLHELSPLTLGSCLYPLFFHIAHQWYAYIKIISVTESPGLDIHTCTHKRGLRLITTLYHWYGVNAGNVKLCRSTCGWQCMTSGIPVEQWMLRAFLANGISRGVLMRGLWHRVPDTIIDVPRYHTTQYQSNKSFADFKISANSIYA